MFFTRVGAENQSICRSHTVISCGGEVVFALGRGETVCGVADGLPEFGDGARGAALEVGLEPGAIAIGLRSGL